MNDQSRVRENPGLDRQRQSVLATGWRRFGYGYPLPTQDPDAVECGGLQHIGKSTAKADYEITWNLYVGYSEVAAPDIDGHDNDTCFL